PAEAVLTAPSSPLSPGGRGARREGVRLRVRATYADGRSSDVTSLSRFETLDEEVAVIDRDGHISARGPGDTALLVRYAGQVAAAHVLVPPPRPLHHT